MPVNIDTEKTLKTKLIINTQKLESFSNISKPPDPPTIKKKPEKSK